MQDDSYSFDIAESEYDNQIAPPPANFKGGGIILKSTFLIKKSNLLVFNYSIQCQIMNTASMWCPNYKQKIRHKTLASSSFVSYIRQLVSPL
jgi:hypothetical protein